MTFASADLQPAGDAPDLARRRAAMEAWRRRSRLIQRLRRLLPAAIGLVLIGLLLAVVAAAVLGRAGQDEGDGVIRMVNPKFYGRQEDGSAFTLSAREAARDRRRASRITLVSPEIVLNSEDAQVTRIRADAGVFDEATKVLRLERRVVLEQPSTGLRVDTDEAVVDTNTNVVQGSRPVQGRAPTGQIAADAYAVYDQGARTVFRGNVRARLAQDDAAEGVNP